MLPIRTKGSNFIYRNPSPDIPDMTGERIEPGHIRSVWELTYWERIHVTNGGNIELSVFAEPIPPVSLNVTGEGATWAVTGIVAERFKGHDGRWYVRILPGGGAMLTESKGYRREGSAWLAQRLLKRILPALETWPS